MRKVRECFATSNFDMFHYLIENRISTSNVEQAVRDGHNPERVKSFIRRKDKMKAELIKEGFSRIVAIPTYFKDDKYWLGDGATRIAALKELQAEGKLPAKHEVQFLVFTEEDMSIDDFIDELQLLNDFNGTKWDVTDKITAKAKAGDKNSQKILSISHKYNMAVSAVSDLMYGQGSTKETTDLTTRLVFENIEPLCDFIHNISLTYNIKEVKAADFLNGLRTVWLDAEKYEILPMVCHLMDLAFKGGKINRDYQIGSKMHITDWQFAMMHNVTKLFEVKNSQKNFTKKFSDDVRASFKRLLRDKWNDAMDNHSRRMRDMSAKRMR